MLGVGESVKEQHGEFSRGYRSRQDLGPVSRYLPAHTISAVSFSNFTPVFSIVSEGSASPAQHPASVKGFGTAQSSLYE
jgi:hypothetical protein